MGYTVEFAPQALQDLAAAVKDIAKDNAEKAQDFGNKLVEKTDVLEAFPRSGNVVPEFSDKTIRELHLKPYRIVYEVRDTQRLVVILRYWHTSRGYVNPNVL